MKKCITPCYKTPDNFIKKILQFKNLSKPFLFLPVVLLFLNINISLAQEPLSPGKIIWKKLLKNEIHRYFVLLKKGEAAEFTVYQKAVDLAVDVLEPSGKKMKTFDSPNGKEGPEPVSIAADISGKYSINIYPLNDQSNLPDSLKESWPIQNQGDYSIEDLKILTAAQYKSKLADIERQKQELATWLRNNAHPLISIDAGSETHDLQPLKEILKDVQVVGLGEATHGTSEFFRMKHRLLEFLVKEMGYTSFYLEASLTRCRYINDYVLYGKGSLDTATVIQGFWTWRTEEVRNMIEWMRTYNQTVPAEKKVKFLGYDLQINNLGWNGLIKFYSLVNKEKESMVDNLWNDYKNAADKVTGLNPSAEDLNLYREVQKKCRDLLTDLVMNQGRYSWLAGKPMYEKNLINLRLIIQEGESFMNGNNDRRDFYMAENILELLTGEKPGTKVVVWAHNGHIAKYYTREYATMGGNLAAVLKNKYYALGFEFYKGSFQTRNMDLENKSGPPDVMTVGDPPEGTLPWYLFKTGYDRFLIDFRHTGSEKITLFDQPFGMHGQGSMYSAKWPVTTPESLKSYDGILFISESTAAKNFSKVEIGRQ